MIAATVAMFAAVLVLANIASKPTMALLYAGLEPGPAGEVVNALETRGVVTEARGGSIYVDASRRDELRMTLAAEGLPTNSAKGYELLDNLSGFGTTAQMFDAAYWRAKEGELARTIVSSPLVASARVHIAVPDAQAFRNRGNPSASVMITPSGDALLPTNAKALRYLVASAVPGLSPDKVSVIDAHNGRIVSGEEDAGQRTAADRAEGLKKNVERLLQARVGYGNAVVEVSVDTVTDSETITERKLDPNGRVAIATETTETSAAAKDAANKGVTVASNLPSGSAANPGESSSNNTETSESVNYEVSETTRQVNRTPGAIRRISVAVLVDGIRSVNDAGDEVWQARSAEELGALRDLVASAVGFDEARGDTITIKSLAFEPVKMTGESPPSGLFSSLQLDVTSLIRVAALAITALVLGLFVLRPILAGSSSGGAEPAGALAPPSADTLGEQPEDTLPVLTGEIDDGTLGDLSNMAVVSDFGFDEGDSDPIQTALADGSDPVARLRKLIDARQDETVEILRGWMQDDHEETA